MEDAQVSLARYFNMKCPHCQGDLKPGKTTYSVNRDGYHLILDDIPVLICDQCHEPLFTEEAVQRVQQMIVMLDAQRKEIEQISLVA